MPDRSERTEKPTAKHKKELRDKGTVARSAELGSWAGLLVVVTLLPKLGSMAATRVDSFFQEVVQEMAHPTPTAAVAVLGQGLGTAALAALPVVVVCTVVGVGVSLAQVGLRFTPKALRIQFNRISPKQGIQRIASAQGMWTLGKTVLKVSVLALVGYAVMRQLMHGVLGGATLPLQSTLSAAGSTLFGLLRDIGVLALVIAGVDYAFQRRHYQQTMRMTKQEVRDEIRRNDGSPEVRRSLRQKARRMSRMRMMAAVAGADAVVVNPTHFAVAIAYDRDRDAAPRVVAKGADLVAARIRARAVEHGVPVVENPPLARTLHAACEIDDVVPTALFTAVARLLAFVYSLSPAARALRSVHAMAPSALPAPPAGALPAG